MVRLCRHCLHHHAPQHPLWRACHVTCLFELVSCYTRHDHELSMHGFKVPAPHPCTLPTHSAWRKGCFFSRFFPFSNNVVLVVASPSLQATRSIFRQFRCRQRSIFLSLLLHCFSRAYVLFRRNHLPRDLSIFLSRSRSRVLYSDLFVGAFCRAKEHMPFENPSRLRS